MNPELGRLRQEGHEFKANLGYRVNTRPGWTIYNEILPQKERKEGKKEGRKGRESLIK
jgi:hypothetical protein